MIKQDYKVFILKTDEGVLGVFETEELASEFQLMLAGVGFQADFRVQAVDFWGE